MNNIQKHNYMKMCEIPYAACRTGRPRRLHTRQGLLRRR